MPCEPAPRGNDRCLRTIVPQAAAAGGPGGIRQVPVHGVMHWGRQHAAARERRWIPKRHTATLVRLEKLEIANVVDLSGVGPKRLSRRCGDAEIVRLLAIGPITGGHVATYNQGEIVRPEPILQRLPID